MKTHEEMKQDADHALKRLETLRTQQRSALDSFKVNRFAFITLAVCNPIIFPLMSALLGIWVALAIMIMMLALISRTSGRMWDAKERREKHRENELEWLDILCERLDEVQRMDTLKLMDIERYNELECKAMLQEAERKEAELQYTRKVKLASGKRMRYVKYVDGEEYFINGW